ncbi:MAG: putative monovalent cation/H+ antiporter subunit A [Deltaproteobacteria bacterium]|nr:putative monovalent cation/H+ antiporter subunit A [Deltaproteobacteria bacterium]TLN04310.1 MAG: putative monovalent cation/H+ antiporter subunit A [bacterium]
MLIALIIAFLAVFAAPWVHRFLPRCSGMLLAVIPAAFFCYFASNIKTIASGETLFTTYPWLPSLSINLSFFLDGLSLLFSLLILGTGALIVIFSSGYLQGNLHLGRFYAFILLFMASMLGLVLAGNIITLFVFWELTSLSSYLLIGFEHTRESARKSALQALLVTGAGGLALLAGFLLLGHAAGSFEITELLNKGEVIRAHGLYLPILLLVLAGAFTKSAQFPFHFWLPSAMEAPAPVSAYLHSATMVKAGVYLLARFSPMLGGTDAWHYLLTSFGAATMLLGVIMAVTQTDLKRLLAYTTVSSLGTLVLLLGLGTSQAAEAAIVYLIVHALYKGALFLVAGTVDHSTGTRDIRELRGLLWLMPAVAVAATLAALSMAGLPPMLGYLGKELLYEAKLQAPQAAAVITGAGLLANVLMVTAAGIFVITPFFRKSHALTGDFHPPPPRLWLSPLILAVLGLILGLYPVVVDKLLVAPAVSALLAEPTEIELALWQGMNPVLILSVITYGAGAALYAGRKWLYLIAAGFRRMADWGPSRWYNLAIAGTARLAYLQTRFLQSGYLRHYLMTVLGTSFLLVFFTLFAKAGFRWGTGGPEALFHEWVIAFLVLAAALFAATSLSRLATVAALGVVGYGLALIYIFFGAPDLAMTQFCIETLSIILFVLVLHRLPRFSILSGRRARIRDAVIAIGNGGVMTALVLTATSEPVQTRISGFFAENALTQAHGRNVVNVILVDFRALDTLGEITVLAVASLGVFALLRARGKKDR